MRKRGLKVEHGKSNATQPTFTTLHSSQDSPNCQRLTEAIPNRKMFQRLRYKGSRNMHQLQNYMEANDVSNENSSKDKDSDDISGSKIADAKKTDLIRVIKRFVD
ncbi:hypothetical protein HZH68_008263 [Vespula germanica]|uniref:Uncharacterized protein n=1 Tax=Vespula germanica TaxID=30212 RepID=A0A834K5R9_VESGE|nr:hypothetical protein HZH68_008263 [Vespula germanica]